MAGYVIYWFTQINPHSYVTAKNDSYFYKALQDSDLLIPDGSGIVLAAKQVYGKNIRKIAGTDLHQFLLEQMDSVSGKVFYRKDIGTKDLIDLRIKMMDEIRGE